MMWLALVTLGVFAIHDVQSYDICKDAELRHGVGYTRHPYDCSQFVMCYYQKNKPTKMVFRSCDQFGHFWDQKELRCLPSHTVDCPYDKCRHEKAEFYKHSDPSKCGAYWKCNKGRAYGTCCPAGEGFHKTKGCIKMAKCTSWCPLRDRVPGDCTRRPISGAPTQYEQYIDNGVWKKTKCPEGCAYNPADCKCSICGVIKAGRVCKPDLVLNFNKGIRDESGYNNTVRAKNVRIRNGEAYFRGGAKIMIDPLKPSKNDEGVLIIKMRYKEYNTKNNSAIQAILTNGHCTKDPASVLIAKHKHFVLIGSEGKKRDMKKGKDPKVMHLPTIKKPYKEIIYIKDDYKLEGRVCGATGNKWALGKLIDHNCGFQIGSAKKMAPYVGVLDDISIYRCKPLEAVINMEY